MYSQKKVVLSIASNPCDEPCRMWLMGHGWLVSGSGGRGARRDRETARRARHAHADGATPRPPSPKSKRYRRRRNRKSGHRADSCVRNGVFIQGGKFTYLLSVAEYKYYNARHEDLQSSRDGGGTSSRPPAGRCRSPSSETQARAPSCTARCARCRRRTLRWSRRSRDR